MDPLHHAFRNPHRNIAALESTFGVTPLDHAGLASEHSTNGLLAQGPEAGQFTDRKMSFQRRLVGLSRDIAQPIGFHGGLFSCVHGASFAGGKIGWSTLDRLAGEILPQRSPKYRRLSEFTGPSATCILVGNDWKQSLKAGLGLTHSRCADNIAHVLACWSVSAKPASGVPQWLWGASAAG
jgi:hypothetical protein